MSTTGNGVFPAVYEAFAGLQDVRGLRRQRQRLGAAAIGTVLEVGIGTGRNFAHYTAADRVVGVDPDPGMLRHAARRTAAAACPVSLQVAAAESLPFATDSFDSVVAALILCTVVWPDKALSEIRRVLKPGGRFVFLEHERSPNATIAHLQGWATPMWSRVSGGCRLDRTTVTAVGAAGFEITHLWRSRRGLGSLVQGLAEAPEVPSSNSPAPEA